MVEITRQDIFRNSIDSILSLPLTVIGYPFVACACGRAGSFKLIFNFIDGLVKSWKNDFLREYLVFGV